MRQIQRWNPIPDGLSRSFEGVTYLAHRGNWLGGSWTLGYFCVRLHVGQWTWGNDGCGWQRAWAYYVLSAEEKAKQNWSLRWPSIRELEARGWRKPPSD